MDTNTTSKDGFAEKSSTRSGSLSQSESFSQDSGDSHTAAEFLNSQLQLEADAREALPYKFDHCTKPLGKLRQSIFSCLTCNPPPTNPKDAYSAAGVCYSCSIECHGEHILVELFSKRDFECDCGTSRLPVTSPCKLCTNTATNQKGGVHSEQPAASNKYNQNFQNRFCGCERIYEPEIQKGTMFQCLGLGTTETGGCGEDWWHPGCVVGLGPDWHETGGYNKIDQYGRDLVSGSSGCIAYDENEDQPLPPGFPAEDDFEGFICYKCVDAHPWIKLYAGTPGFLPAIIQRSAESASGIRITADAPEATSPALPNMKRSAHGTQETDFTRPSKRAKSQTDIEHSTSMESTVLSATNDIDHDETSKQCKLSDFPPVSTSQFSLFFKEDFRSYLCHCNTCFSYLEANPQLLEPEETYEPSVSSCDDGAPGSTAGSGSLYDRGESVLKNIDRVRAIEGVMAYNHLKDKLKPFFQQFAESGKVISAEDIKAYFAKIRGDELAIKEAGEAVRMGGNKN